MQCYNVICYLVHMLSSQHLEDVKHRQLRFNYINEEVGDMLAQLKVFGGTAFELEQLFLSQHLVLHPIDLPRDPFALLFGVKLVIGHVQLPGIPPNLGRRVLGLTLFPQFGQIIRPFWGTASSAQVLISHYRPHIPLGRPHVTPSHANVPVSHARSLGLKLLLLLLLLLLLKLLLG